MQRAVLVTKSTFWTCLFENNRRQALKISDKREHKQQRKHNFSTKETFMQYLTYIKVISIDDLFVYTTNGAFYEGKSSSLLARPTFREKRESFSDVIYVSANQRARIYLSFVKNDGAWSKLQNFIETCYKQLIACFVRDIWH